MEPAAIPALLSDAPPPPGCTHQPPAAAGGACRRRHRPLTSISANDSLNLATVDLQLPGGQITVQGFADFTQPRLIHAITGGTGRYTGADGEFSLAFPSPHVLHMTLTLQP